MENIEQQIIATLEKIRPFLMKDGGDVQFVKFDNGIVFLVNRGNKQKFFEGEGISYYFFFVSNNYMQKLNKEQNIY